MSLRRPTRYGLALVTLVVLVALYLSEAHAGMMGVGKMMSPTNGAGGSPGGGFAILTESSDPLATESSSILVTESAP